MKRLLAVFAMAAILASGLAWAREEEEVNNGQDPTKPLTWFDLCYQWRQPLAFRWLNSSLAARSLAEVMALRRAGRGGEASGRVVSLMACTPRRTSRKPSSHRRCRWCLPALNQ